MYLFSLENVKKVPESSLVYINIVSFITIAHLCVCWGGVGSVIWHVCISVCVMVCVCV